MAKFLKIYCHADPCSSSIKTWNGDPYNGLPIHNNLGINTEGVGSSAEGYHLINLDEVVSVSSFSGDYSNDAGRLELTLKGNPSIHYEGSTPIVDPEAPPGEEMGEGVVSTNARNISPKKIQFIFGCCDDPQAPVASTAASEQLALIDSLEIAQHAGDESQLFKAHKQLLEVINSQPDGVVEWKPQGIKGYYIDPSGEPSAGINNAIIRDVKLLGYVYYNMTANQNDPAFNPMISAGDYTSAQILGQIDVASSSYNEPWNGRISEDSAFAQTNSARWENFVLWVLYPNSAPDNFTSLVFVGNQQEPEGGHFASYAYKLDLPNEDGSTTSILIGSTIDESGQTTYDYPAYRFLDIGTWEGRAAIFGNTGEPIYLWPLPEEHDVSIWQALNSKIAAGYRQSGYRRNGPPFFSQFNGGNISAPIDPFS